MPLSPNISLPVRIARIHANLARRRIGETELHRAVIQALAARISDVLTGLSMDWYLPDPRVLLTLDTVRDISTTLVRLAPGEPVPALSDSARGEHGANTYAWTRLCMAVSYAVQDHVCDHRTNECALCDDLAECLAFIHAADDVLRTARRQAELTRMAMDGRTLEHRCTVTHYATPDGLGWRVDCTVDGLVGIVASGDGPKAVRQALAHRQRHEPTKPRMVMVH